MNVTPLLGYFFPLLFTQFSNYFLWIIFFLSLDLSFSLLEQFKGSLKNSNFIILTLINDKIMKTA